jgi:hypothetical protein
VQLSGIVAGAIAAKQKVYAMHTTTFRWAAVGRLLTASLFVVCVHAAAGEPGRQQAQKATPSPGRTKVAEGEYVVLEGENGGAVGPFGEEIYNFHETWTLWRTATGGYQVEGERRFESPKDITRSARFLLELSRDLTLTGVTEFGRLRWRRDSGPLTCKFLLKELDCSSNAKNRQNAIDLKLPMEHPFGLFWPISAFSLSGITREAERDPNQPTRVQLVSIEQPSADIPVNPMIREGELRYLGDENIDIAGQPGRAFKFSVKVALSPQLVIWTSPKGVLLKVAIQRESKDSPEESMKLVRFQEWEGFQ